jgi:hypothetical protein
MAHAVKSPGDRLDGETDTQSPEGVVSTTFILCGAIVAVPGRPSG